MDLLQDHSEETPSVHRDLLYPETRSLDPGLTRCTPGAASGPGEVAAWWTIGSDPVQCDGFCDFFIKRFIL